MNVAERTRTDKDDSFTKHGRRKIGRKGVGKLSALSVSEEVLVKTKCDGEKSGFVLSREIPEDNRLRPLSDDDITFTRVDGNQGTSVIMRDPRYSLNKTPSVIKKNLLKIFPLVDENFKIYIIPEDGSEIIVDNFDKEMISQLGGLITLGNDFADLAQYFNNPFPKKKKKPLLEIRDAHEGILNLKNNQGELKSYTISIHGWMGAYTTTRNRKLSYTEFPDNFISLFANCKLGQYNILSDVGKNRLIEVFIVGQLHVDLFEETELPDMALSNRQGYKDDDPRYKFVVDYVRDTLLEDIVGIRKRFADYAKESKNREKLLQQQKKEAELREQVNKFKKEVAEYSAQKISEVEKISEKSNIEQIKSIVEKEANAFLPIVGLKSIIDAQKRKILISHTRSDKDLADVVYDMLLFNGVPAEDVIYTSCDDEISRIPDDDGLFDYLRSFFVESYSNQGIFVIFVTSHEMHKSWGAVIEAGASWLIKLDHKVFNIADYQPQQPLNTAPVWQTSIRKNNSLTMSTTEIDRFAVKIEGLCDKLGYQKKDRLHNTKKLKTYVVVED